MAALDLVRSEANIRTKARVVTRNNFPTASGLASSASGFAALILAARAAAQLPFDRERASDWHDSVQLLRLARYTAGS